MQLCHKSDIGGNWKNKRGVNSLTPRLSLVDQCFLVRANALAEHVVRPPLVGEHNRDEDQRHDGHDRQRVL